MNLGLVEMEIFGLLMVVQEKPHLLVVMVVAVAAQVVVSLFLVTKVLKVENQVKIRLLLLVVEILENLRMIKRELITSTTLGLKFGSQITQMDM